MIPLNPITARRNFHLPGYCTLGDVDMEGDYVSPLQMIANSSTGPVLLAYHWSDADSVRAYYNIIRKNGYLPGIPFNNVIDRALQMCGRRRSDIYMTQVFHLLPLKGRSSYVPSKHLDLSFQAITCHELKGRKVIAMGVAAVRTCYRNGITPDWEVDHPSARGVGRTVEYKATKLAAAIQALS